MYDICIIGAGVVGCAIARELSKYELKVVLLEKDDDVSNGASKANSGIVHGGYAAEHGTIKGELSVKGNRLYKKLNEELNFGYRETGSIVIGFNNEDKFKINKLYANGIKNGVEGLEILDGKKIKELEPNINDEVIVGLYCKHAGITSPYELTIALAENAVENGVELRLENEVIDINKKNDRFIIKTNRNLIKARYVINCTGVYSDKIANMLNIYNFKIIPRRGQYVLLEKGYGSIVNKVIFQVPSKNGKGVLVTSTYHGNFMIGPNAEEIQDKEDVSTNSEILNYIVETARKSVPDFDIKKVITSFSGIRATSNTKDFIISESNVKGFINVAGIDSPGLTASPAIAKKVLDILLKIGVVLKENIHFTPYRKPIIKDKDLNAKEIEELIELESGTDKIICRCELVTEGEIVEALKRNINIKSTDSIKRRTRAGMGKCQGGYCRSRVREIIARELKIPIEEIPSPGVGSSILPKRAKRTFYNEIK